jgi:AcrR family transcriptional regulator
VHNLEDKKQLIFRSAHELFSKKGFKDTNVPEITNLAGVAVGTFYNYYNSKDEIFLDVFNFENEQIKKDLFSSITPDDDPISTMTRMMIRSRDLISSNLILREWYNKDLYSKMEKHFYESYSNNRMNEFMQTYLAELIQQWQTEGKIRTDLDSGMVLALFNSTIYVDMHKTEIGIQYFPQLTYKLIEYIMKGVTDCSDLSVTHSG